MAGRNGSTVAGQAQHGVEEISASHLTIDRSAVRSAHADIADIQRAAIQRLQASDATITSSAVGIASIEHATLHQSAVGVVVGRSVACDEVRTVILASPIVRGEVHTWLDLRSAVAIGLGIALGRALLAGAGALGRRVR